MTVWRDPVRLRKLSIFHFWMFPSALMLVFPRESVLEPLLRLHSPGVILSALTNSIFTSISCFILLKIQLPSGNLYLDMYLKMGPNVGKKKHLGFLLPENLPFPPELLWWF